MGHFVGGRRLLDRDEFVEYPTGGQMVGGVLADGGLDDVNVARAAGLLEGLDDRVGVPAAGLVAVGDDRDLARVPDRFGVLVERRGCVSRIAGGDTAGGLNRVDVLFALDDVN